MGKCLQLEPADIRRPDARDLRDTILGIELGLRLAPLAPHARHLPGRTPICRGAHVGGRAALYIYQGAIGDEWA